MKQEEKKGEEKIGESSTHCSDGAFNKQTPYLQSFGAGVYIPRVLVQNKREGSEERHRERDRKRVSEKVAEDLRKLRPNWQ